MDWTDYLAPALRQLAPYKPGITEEQLRLARGLREIHKFSSNEAPFPPSPAVLSAMQGALGQSHRYPDAHALLERLAARLRIPPGMLVLGNGSIDVIGALVRAFVSPGQNVVLSAYGYCAYPAFVIEQGAQQRIAPSGARFEHDVEQLLARVDERTRMLLVDSPTNLAGQGLGAAALAHLVERLPAHVLLVLDEAYLEFAGPQAPRHTELLPLRHPNVVVTRTFSKAYGLAGLRIGYGIADAGLIACLQRIRPPFPASRVALAGAAAALDDDAHLERVVAATLSGRRRLTEALRALGATAHDSDANFVLADFGARTASLYEGLLAHGLIPRAMHAYGLPTHLRIAVGTADEIDRLLDVCARLLATSTAPSLDGALG
ncbi:pyridoxal phosphate-dependent aminotransferase [Burkholderia plantarii]|uniref:Histidinol-phosphate aminotransferase n=1 Tax=Burkholderia plantarii TaxID=41899 RepID=A0A0B6RZN3_BURPL|nr:aminotransferase class I/II-fold pyridoxal phosphate-dependent enzyme [Burkholderia plantarii]AJK47634.1 histidinol-phosphate aminotransferase HisC [Burkholderia plantarii]